MTQVTRLAAAALVMLSSGPATQAPLSKGRLFGYAQANGQRLAAVSVEVRPDWKSIASNEFWRLGPTPTQAIATATTARDGTFSIDVEPGPLYEVTFRKRGFKTQRYSVYANRPFLASLEPGTDPAPVAKSPTSGQLTGHILDAKTGHPVAGAVVRGPWSFDALSTAGADGAFTVGLTKEIAEQPLIVLAKGYAIQAIPKSAFSLGKESKREIELVPGSGVEGRIVGADGKAAAGLSVLIDTDVNISDSETYSGVAWLTHTDLTGRYRFAEVPAGSRYWVRTLLPTGTPIELGQGLVTPDVVRLPTTFTAPLTEVTGRVRWANNAALTQGQVHVLRLFSGKIRQPLVLRETPFWPVDGTGAFRIPALAPGRYELAFWADKAEIAVRVIQVPSKKPIHFDIQLTHGRSIQSKIVDAQGKPIDAALIRGLPWADDELIPLAPPDHPKGHNGRFMIGNVRVLSRPSGVFQLDRLRTYQPIKLIISKQGYKTRTVRIEVDGAAPKTIRLEKT